MANWALKFAFVTQGALGVPYSSLKCHQKSEVDFSVKK